MKKVFVLPAGEDWIVDRFVSEWNIDNADISTSNPHSADVIWLLASWCWNHIPFAFLKSKKVLTTVHHVVPEKFGPREEQQFRQRDQITTAYHVYNETTKEFIQKFTEKPIHLLGYWANQRIWKRDDDKSQLKKNFGIPEDCLVVGSFQRDTEGKDMTSPKLEKGPDLLADYLESLSKERKVHVVLAGWRRQYIISRLHAAKIGFTYHERPQQNTINKLYQTLDLYPVSARREGGPQALIECGLIGVPVISRDVGIARQVLSHASVNDELSLAHPSIPNVESWKLPDGYLPYRKLIQEL